MDCPRPRAADDFDTIRQRLEELRREREAAEAENGDAARRANESPGQIGAAPPRAPGGLAAALGPHNLRQIGPPLAQGRRDEPGAVRSRAALGLDASRKAHSSRGLAYSKGLDRLRSVLRLLAALALRMRFRLGMPLTPILILEEAAKRLLEGRNTGVQV